MFKKTLKEISKIEKRIEISKENIKNLKLLKTNWEVYLEEDKKELLNLYLTEVEPILRKVLKLKKQHKIWFLFKKHNPEKIIISRYLSIIYFKYIIEINNICSGHMDFMKLYLKEKTKRYIWYYNLRIYKAKSLTLINTPSYVFDVYKGRINDNIYNLSQTDFDIFSLSRVKTNIWNTKTLFKNIINPILFKIVKFTWNLISKIRFTRRTEGLISKENLDEFKKNWKPWDILLTRWNWNATNISIPHFWKHMSMYLWSWEDLKKVGWLNMKIDDNSHYIIEATWKWVEIKKIEELTSHNDYLGVFRTTFSEDKISRAIKNTCSKLWMNYDFLFNFQSEEWLVCSELVIKSFLKENENDEWVEINLTLIWWNYSFPPNDLVKIAKSWEYVKPLFFIDSIEKTKENFISNTEELLKSGSRPKLTIFLK